MPLGGYGGTDASPISSLALSYQSQLEISTSRRSINLKPLSGDLKCLDVNILFFNNQEI